MAGRGWGKGKFLIGFVVLAALAGSMAWVERGTLLAWFYLQRLAAADEAGREAWVERVAGLGEEAVPGLLGMLGRPDPRACGNARAALERLVADWGSTADPRTADLALHLAREFSRLSPAGRQQALALMAAWFRPDGPPASRSLLQPAARLLGEAAAVEDEEVRSAALELCARVLAQPDNAEILPSAQDLVGAGLRAAAADNRLRAVRLALYFPPSYRLRTHVVPLLADPEVEVRRAALLAVGPAPADEVSEESLLPSLHDSDPEVRRLCEVALGGRGLRPDLIELGRLLTDPRPVTRLLVLDRLYRTPDLDPGLWLRRLSHDASPAVRVAAMRAMTQQPHIDLSDRIDQMARSDPSPTVCQLARYYLTCPRPSRPRPASERHPPPGK
jgi:hypothetical protein